MTPDKYNRVKEIFLAACDKPAEERLAYAQKAANGDAEILREVESLLKEHVRETQVMPENPESPIGSMSAILSRAQIEMGEELKGGEGLDAHNQYLDESTPSSASGSGIVDAGRFMAGTVVAGRYRIIELLGRGGMGEVYRADDLTLNQSVALKFLPAIFGQDKQWLERFRNEVRLARQVTHPNVCRVFDIGEFQGEQFISMEYVDGENLASTLRRIGRVPDDKGVQIARQLCAGLAAAHDRGVLHRDLKPANVMIDGRGSVRITDFGLAAPAEQLRKDGAAAIRAGTPAYMSPEQLAGKAVTVRSDIYSLGLVMYEMFTGRRAFRGDSLRDYQKLHSSEEPTPPSEIVDDMDPIVERVILKCLEKDPKNRPASAMAVSASLPGGNPLREILAAGETPSPEEVAAAGGTLGGLRPYFVSLFVGVGLLCLFFVVLLAPKAFVVQKAIHEKPPAVLADRAREFLDRIGYSAKPRDTASGFGVNTAYYVHVQNTKHGSDRWSLLTRPRPGLVTFWYRESPELLVPWQPNEPLAENDPPQVRPGMVRVMLDPLGRLIDLQAEPRDMMGEAPMATTQPMADTLPVATAPRQTVIPPPNWTPLLKAAEMDSSRFTPVEPTGVPPVYADARAAWEGTFVDAPEEKLHVEAAAYRGKPVFFAITGGWREETLSQDKAEMLSLGSVNLIVQTLVSIAMLVAGGWMALRNYRTGKGDRQGATRMGLAFFLLGLVAWLFRSHHVPDLVMEFKMFTRSMGTVVYTVGIVWVFYMALEPHVRRVWPETVISWSRMLAGRWIDPLVGRDVLIGAVTGTAIMLLETLDHVLPPLVGLRAPMPSITSTMMMLESVTNLSTLFTGAIQSLYVGLLMLLFLVILRMALKRKSLVSLVFVFMFVFATARWSGIDWISWVVQGVIALLFLFLLVRHGLVAMIFCLMTRSLLAYFPVTFDWGAWYASTTLVAIATVLAILAAGAYAALGGKSLITIRWSDR